MWMVAEFCLEMEIFLTSENQVYFMKTHQKGLIHFLKFMYIINCRCALETSNGCVCWSYLDLNAIIPKAWHPSTLILTSWVFIHQNKYTGHGVHTIEWSTDSISVLWLTSSIHSFIQIHWSFEPVQSSLTYVIITISNTS